MKYLFAFSLLLFSSHSFSKDRYLKVHCDQFGGEVLNKFKCPKSKVTIPFKFCVIKRENNTPLFFDGCTGPTGGNTELFYPSCIEHDLCYHREPATNGKSQKKCDQELRENLLDSCQTLSDSKTCETWAHGMYRAVRMFGKLAYNCADVREED